MLLRAFYYLLRFLVWGCTRGKKDLALALTIMRCMSPATVTCISLHFAHPSPILLCFSGILVNVTAKGEQVKPSGERGSGSGRGRHVVWTMFALSGKPHKHLRKRLSLWDSRPWWSGRTGAFSSKDVCLGSRQHVHPRPQSSYEHTFA